MDTIWHGRGGWDGWASRIKIKIISQLPTINKKENIKVVVHNDKSVMISCLNYEGKRVTRTHIIPYKINGDTARSTYRNGILEIMFSRE